jgi:hypothetical protein
MQTHHGEAVVLALALTALYVAPVFLGLYALISSDGMQEDSSAVRWFAAFLMSSESTLNEFHKVLMPIMTTISIAAFTGKPTRRMFLLAGFVMVAFMVTLFTSVWFDVSTVRDGLQGLDGGLTAEPAKVFLGRIRETLITYFMMLVGISVVNATQRGGGGK